MNAVAPGFIETDMTQGLSQELKDKMLANIPLGDECRKGGVMWRVRLRFWPATRRHMLRVMCWM